MFKLCIRVNEYTNIPNTRSQCLIKHIGQAYDHTLRSAQKPLQAESFKMTRVCSQEIQAYDINIQNTSIKFNYCRKRRTLVCQNQQHYNSQQETVQYQEGGCYRHSRGGDTQRERKYLECYTILLGLPLCHVYTLPRSDQQTDLMALIKETAVYLFCYYNYHYSFRMIRN